MFGHPSRRLVGAPHPDALPTDQRRQKKSARYCLRTATGPSPTPHYSRLIQAAKQQLAATQREAVRKEAQASRANAGRPPTSEELRALIAALRP